MPGDTAKVVVRSLPMEAWAVLQHDAFEGYISWEQYLRNQARLRENAQGANWNKGAPGAGRALLQGLVRCGRCGRAMHVCYGNNPSYACDVANCNYGDPRCQTFTVAHVDPAVTQLFLQAVQPAHLEIALAALEEIETPRQSLAQQWQQRLERTRYEVDLARRRYERVDPDRRLVAAELERAWEEKLQACQQLEREWTQVQTQELAPLSAADQALIRQLVQDVPALWEAESTTPGERKRLIRCLVQELTLDSFTRPGFSLIHVRWHTGTIISLEVKRLRPGGPPAPRALLDHIRELAQHHPDDQIADILNAEGLPTTRGLTWTLGRVRGTRNKHHIPTACPYVTAAEGPRGDGLIKAAEAAEHLGTSFSMIADWFRRGLLVGHQHQPGTPLWIRLTASDQERLDGSASLQPDMIPLKQAPTALGLTSEQMRAEIHAGHILTYRLFINNRWRLYVQRPAGQSTRKFDI